MIQEQITLFPVAVAVVDSWCGDLQSLQEIFSLTTSNTTTSPPLSANSTPMYHLLLFSSLLRCFILFLGCPCFLAFCLA
ncbi:hypothetical protein LINPERPRIM_LOCUS7341 [Linum perenne]